MTWTNWCFLLQGFILDWIYESYMIYKYNFESTKPIFIDMQWVKLGIQFCSYFIKVVNYDWNNITIDITFSIYQSQYIMLTIINNIILELFKINLELQTFVLF